MWFDCQQEQQISHSPQRSSGAHRVP